MHLRRTCLISDSPTLAHTPGLSPRVLISQRVRAPLHYQCRQAHPFPHDVKMGSPWKTDSVLKRVCNRKWGMSDSTRVYVVSRL
jgi:hypothetical protein